MRKNRFLLINLFIPILLGAVLYYITSPDVYFVRVVDKILGIGIHIDYREYSCICFTLFRYYFFDMLWAYALVFALSLFMGDNTAMVLKVFIITFAFSTLMEILQLSEYFPGTFDFLDILVELFAEIIAVIIINTKFHKGGTGYEKN